MVSGDERINKSNHKGTENYSKKLPNVFKFQHDSLFQTGNFLHGALYGYILGAVKFKWSHSFVCKHAFVFGAEF